MSPTQWGNKSLPPLAVRFGSSRDELALDLALDDPGFFLGLDLAGDVPAHSNPTVEK